MFPAPARLAGFLALLAAGVASAADRGAQCAGMEDDARRLACYDEAFGRAVPAAPSAGQGELADAATPPADEAAPAVAAAAGAAAGEFGQVDLQREEEKSKPPVPESISAVVLRVERDRRDFHKVWLDNEQVWRQTEAASGLRIDVGDTVIIRRRTFGSHVIRTADSNRSARVERVE